MLIYRFGVFHIRNCAESHGRPAIFMRMLPKNIKFGSIKHTLGLEFESNTQTKKSFSAC